MTPAAPGSLEPAAQGVSQREATSGPSVSDEAISHMSRRFSEQWSPLFEQDSTQKPSPAPWAPRSPSPPLGFLLPLRLLLLAGLTQGLSGFPFLLRNLFLILDSELWGPGSRNRRVKHGVS